MKTTRTQRAKKLCNALGWKNPHATVVAAVSNALKLEGRIEYKLGWHGAMDSLDGPNGERAQMKAYAERIREDLTISRASVDGLLKERDAALAEAANLKQKISEERANAEVIKSAISAKCEAALVDLDAMRNDRNRYADIARQRFEEIAKLSTQVETLKAQDQNSQTGHISCWKKLGEVQRELDEQRTCSERLEKYAFNARAQYEECRDKFGETLKTLDVTARERDTLRLQLEILQRTSDSAIRKQDTLRGQLESVRAAHDSLICERDVALSDVTRLTKERDLLISQKMPPRNVWVPWNWRVEHVGSTFDSTKPRHADGCSGAYKDSDAGYSGCIPSCPVAIAYLESTATRLTKERDAPISRKLPKDNVLVPHVWRYAKQANGTAYHSDDCDRQQGWLHESNEKYPGCLPACPVAIEYLAEMEKRATPILPSSLRVNQRIEWTCNDYGARCTGDVVYVGGGRANVKRDGAGIVILFDTNADADAICIVEHNDPHAECDRKIAEVRESLRSARAEYEQRLLEVAQSRSFVSDQLKTSIGETKAAERERDTALRDLNKTRSELAAVHKQLIEERSISDTCAFDGSALIKERDALQFRVNAQAAEIKRLNERMDVLDKALAASEVELARAREYCKQHRDERDAKDKYCRELQALLDGAVSEFARAKAAVESHELTAEKARAAPVTERPELVQVPDSFKSPFDGSHSPACYGAPHSDSRCIRDCKRRIAWEAAGCPKI